MTIAGLSTAAAGTDLSGSTTLASLPWGIDFGGGGAVFFPLAPDGGAGGGIPFTVNWMIANGDGSARGNFMWSHLITTAEDLAAGCGTSGCGYTGQLAAWVVEGSFNIPVPAAAYLFGSGLVGLAGVARLRRKKVAK
jgi:hypothetical protein